MRVPDGIGGGVAKVTLSFEGWKKGKVKPAVVEIPVNTHLVKAKK